MAYVKAVAEEIISVVGTEISLELRMRWLCQYGHFFVGVMTGDAVRLSEFCIGKFLEDSMLWPRVVSHPDDMLNAVLIARLHEQMKEQISLDFMCTGNLTKHVKEP